MYAHIHLHIHIHIHLHIHIRIHIHIHVHIHIHIHVHVHVHVHFFCCLGRNLQVGDPNQYYLLPQIDNLVKEPGNNLLKLILFKRAKKNSCKLQTPQSNL